MSDQHAATALTAAAVIATILVARAVALGQGDRRRVARAANHVRRRTAPRADKAASSAAAVSDAASCAVREAEQHVNHCWQQLQTSDDPSE
ncbi:hypothetical protein [Streptomyces sp. NPDC054794]